MNDNTQILKTVLRKATLEPNDIIYCLWLRGHTPASVAKDLAVSRPSVSEVIHSRKRSIDIAAHIATLLGTNLNRLWPNSYTYTPRNQEAAHLKVANA